ncbi:MAG: hypothetical protein OK456_03805 [Thaumarchaeota archaeon]|nr:hypothetical protein [Nitrososphaerota archaeon]
MLSSSMLKEEIDAIVDIVAEGHADEAKQRLNLLTPNVSSEYGRGATLALNGIIHVMENKADRMADREKLLRATERIPKSQTVDDMDKGYMQTISKWAKKTREAGKEVPKEVPVEVKDSASSTVP